LKIAYLTTFDSADLHKWSGLGSSIVDCLERQGIEVVRVGSFKEYSDPWLLLKRLYYNKLIRNGGFRTDRDTTVLKALGKAAASRLADLQVDAIFSPGTLPISYLDVAKPILFWTDATFPALVDYYPDLTGLCQATIKSGSRADAQALSRCRAAIFSSQWAADSALKICPVAASKIHVVPFGANFANPPAAEEVTQAIEERLASETIDFLFVGLNWNRKGGDTAVAIVQSLVQRGLNARLHLAGSHPPPTVTEKPFVTTYGVLSKARPDEAAKLRHLFRTARFFIMPPTADCTPCVFSEANAFGVPCLSRATGGIPDIVKSGQTGFLLSHELSEHQMADLVFDLVKDPQRYREMAMAARTEYQTRLNWDSAGKQVAKILSAALA
jgi:glycosyltransferase involved in cell wall biosynthesis